MTDVVNDINSITGTGRNPISQMGKVVYNGFIDQEEVAIRRENLKLNRALYPGPVDDPSLSILPREIVMTRRFSDSHKRRNNHTGYLYVMSTLNGAFEKTDTGKLDSILDEREFPGISATRCLLDTVNNQSPEVDVVIQVGGLATTVNTSSEKIRNGDQIYADFPDVDNPKPHGDRKGADRYLIQSRPYKPDLDTLTFDVLKDYLMETTKNRSALMNEAAKHFNRFVGFAAIAGARILTSLGADLNAPVDISNSMGILEKPATNARIMPTIQKYLLGESQLVTRDARNKRPIGDEGELFDLQNNVIHALFSSFNKVRLHKTRRIIGKAMTPADPGKEFDILLGRYAS
jgi:hypothetical protein